MLACYVLQQTKRFAPYCGGDSHIMWFQKNGPPILMKQNDVRKAEGMFTNYYTSLQPLIAACANPLSGSEFADRYREFKEVVEHWRDSVIDDATTPRLPAAVVPTPSFARRRRSTVRPDRRGPTRD